ncbi:hypothetical protein BFP97_05035 [Roseivirga sp. 4D4]|uniref:glycosyltransferase family 2 protein n=1 Tax=Roseivirga sp. 4D4 TaxID=1889784 RepID=UPI00085396B5|nr:glycosyltransferase family 2 protein [Roseivirga sp. 4D4]OEK00913.1 hypothetical protein BFP97_05035 [Roseivirga sp. 4D4]
MEIILWTSVGIIFYHFIGYGVTLTLLNRLKSGKPSPAPLSDTDLPEVTMLIAAYNEEDIIEEKILNSISLDYPKDKLKIVVVSDGSDDHTNNIVRKHPEVELYFKPLRQGKIAAVNRVMPLISTPYTVFTDANVMINKDGLRQMTDHFQRNRVAAVSGEKTVMSAASDSASASGEGFYWKYESYLKRMDAQWNTLVGSAGELFAIRTHLFETIEENTLIEDFIMTMNLAAKGYTVAYEPKALAIETASATMAEEQKRKVRISAGGIQAVIKLLPLLNFFKYGKLTFQYVSHRALRWTLNPIALLLILICSFQLASEFWLYEGLLRTQLIFYLLAFVGYVIRDGQTNVKWLHIPYYFIFMHLCIVLGWLKYFSGKQQVTWEKSKRVASTISLSQTQLLK